MGIPEPEVVENIAGATFLITDSASGAISFVSDGYRRFAAKKLQKIQQRVANLMISNLLSNPESRPSLLYLPGYLEQAGRLDELVTYLSADHIGRMVEHTGSWKPVQRQTSRGIVAARKLERDADLVRLGIQEASIVQFEQAETWRAQVEAYMALGMQESALELANATISQEDRLHLLAVICRAKKRKKQGIEPELDEQVRSLFGRIDKAGSENHSLDIAADLIYSHPDLAIELVRASTNKDESERNISDIKLAQFSIGMIGSVGDVEKKHDALAAMP